VEETTKQLERW